MIIPVGLDKDSYNIVIERGALKRAAEIFDLDRKVMIVTDSQVPVEHYCGLASACKVSVAGIFQEGEASKTPQNFLNICNKMLKEGFSRRDCVVAVGGGVAGDMAGFAAACYMRGIDFYNVPTTLLSQVDSSVGGKTAVDLNGVKNIIGAFHQPRGVIIDPDVLKTLSHRQFACGAAEIIKIAACMAPELFERIESCGIAGNPDIDEIIAAAVALKVRVVEEDEREKGLRKVLNFGHTLGHGIEAVTGLYHGECVALGMLPMCSGAVRERIQEVLKRENLPVGFFEKAPEPVKVIEAAMHDKKAEGESIVTVRLDNIGSFRFEAASEEQLTRDYLEVFG